jgi:hypothetical protein
MTQCESLLSNFNLGYASFGIGLNGVLEYGSIGVLGFECITPLLHHSSTRFFTILEPGDI